MCTDGLSNMVEDEDMFDIVKGARDIVEAVQMLIEKANSNGGRDNIGVVLAEPLADEVSAWVKDGIVLGKRYEVLSKIGAGGMADVYKGKRHNAEPLCRDQSIAKKEYREDENFVRKFHSEAQAAAGLLNPNIVNVYDVGEDRGLYYMVMELVEGITLKEYIEKRESFPIKKSLALQFRCAMVSGQHMRQVSYIVILNLRML